MIDKVDGPPIPPAPKGRCGTCRHYWKAMAVCESTSAFTWNELGADVPLDSVSIRPVDALFHVGPHFGCIQWEEKYVPRSALCDMCIVGLV